mmetsp:Transcript_113858/g.361942  ORF Transcript_113858/g.361942 Transcript_113858/m.361942 type:complete len:258 (-) Transcript_113858:334-1107(-)
MWPKASCACLRSALCWHSACRTWASSPIHFAPSAAPWALLAAKSDDIWVFRFRSRSNSRWASMSSFLSTASCSRTRPTSATSSEDCREKSANCSLMATTSLTTFACSWAVGRHCSSACNCCSSYCKFRWASTVGRAHNSAFRWAISRCISSGDLRMASSCRRANVSRCRASYSCEVGRLFSWLRKSRTSCMSRVCSGCWRGEKPPKALPLRCDCGAVSASCRRRSRHSACSSRRSSCCEICASVCMCSRASAELHAC